ncbi:MAG: FAD-dependent monooxygenase [Thermoanaerobaculia bacterium]
MNIHEPPEASPPSTGPAQDVVVVGGGPVGLASAIAARLRGLTVLVVDRQRPPIDKACGEGLMPSGLAALRALGVALPARSMPFRGIRYVSDGCVAEAAFPDGLCGRGVRRTELAAALHERAIAVGVTFEWGVRVLAAGSGEVRSADRVWPCRFVVGADGLHSHLRRDSGLERAGRARRSGPGERSPTPGRNARFGVTRHLRLAPWSDHVEVTFGDRAEVYVTPLAADEIGVAILWSGGKGGFDELLASRIPASFAQRIAGAEALGRDRGAGPFLQRTRGTVSAGRRLALVGDAAGYVDALTGEGLSLGFESALELGEALALGDLGVYARRAANLAALPQRWTYLLLALARRPALRRRLVAALSADPVLFSGFLGLLGARRPFAGLPLARSLRLCSRLAWPLPAAMAARPATCA